MRIGVVPLVSVYHRHGLAAMMNFSSKTVWIAMLHGSIQCNCSAEQCGTRRSSVGDRFLQWWAIVRIGVVPLVSVHHRHGLAPMMIFFKQNGLDCIDPRFLQMPLLCRTMGNPQIIRWRSIFAMAGNCADWCSSLGFGLSSPWSGCDDEFFKQNGSDCNDPRFHRMPLLCRTMGNPQIITWRLIFAMAGDCADWCSSLGFSLSSPWSGCDDEFFQANRVGLH